MSGTVVVHAEPPGGIRRAGTFRVVVDGVKAGQVKQGTTVRLPVPAGTHTVRVTGRDRTRSNTVTVEVAEGRDVLVTARGTGMVAFLALPFMVGAALPRGYGLALFLLTAVVVFAVPGLMFRVRDDGDPELRTTRPAPADGAGEEEHGGIGLWWESDPVLAKRFRRSSGS
ncbi:hypothetical protein LK07_09645 [Streptomyces pluripotens]|uniref:PEGA domain-containing protein n=1 Tax=Streptomyces pluripotens TaxID=1355015 RepID=A0A221NWH5_9ACTN|nr:MULTISPECIES: hypothetical protein [Streptomyces]ARP70003.1 hypothetical protein LK06_008535 [Streptomyces pluripotens]ASN24262.1 hypothetical protein LK07_09645 [Streptomyces pluripotens]KIE25292.1 hypothetical protein LK08_19740 [Streptomyces sp. MUSC 125]MCH0559974.1 hypothetical protein [Streptomyces sp. MUM 16J]